MSASDELVAESRSFSRTTSFLFCLLISGFALHTANAHAFGFGELQRGSHLGRSLDVSLELLSPPDDAMSLECFAVRMVDLARSNRTLVANERIKLAVDSDRGALRLRVRTPDLMVEPAFFLIAEWNCGRAGKVVREYTVLLDPPGTPLVDPAKLAPRPAVVSAPATQAPSRSPIALGEQEIRYRVRPGDTLSGISSRLLPGDREAQQQLVQAIVNANPGDFPDRNPNRLHAGANLRIPGRHDIQRLAAAPPVSQLENGQTSMRDARLARRDSPASFRLKLATELDTRPRPDPISADKLLELEEQYRREAELREQIAQLQSRLEDLSRSFDTVSGQLDTAGQTESVGREVLPAADPAQRTTTPVTPPAPPPVPVVPVVQIETPVVPASQPFEPDTESLLEKPFFWVAIFVVFLLGILITRFTLGSSRKELEETGSVQDLYSLFGDDREEGTSPGPFRDLEPEVPDEARPDWSPVFKRHYIPERKELKRKATFNEINDVLMQAETNLFAERPDSAIDLLRDRIEVFPEFRNEPSLWLMLMHIYRQHQLRREFDDLSRHFRVFFNIDPPNWEVADREQQAQLSGGLETLYPHIMQKITSQWPDPECRKWIEGLLVDNRSGDRQGFALSVADELMTLIDVLRVREEDPGLEFDEEVRL